MLCKSINYLVFTKQRVMKDSPSFVKQKEPPVRGVYRCVCTSDTLGGESEG